jgi:hypothetical protein
MWRFARRLKLASAAQQLDDSRSSADRDQKLGKLVDLLARDNDIAPILEQYDATTDTLRLVFEDLIQSGFDFSVKNVWQPIALLTSPATLEYILYHRQKALPLPLETLKAYAENPQVFIDAEQKQRIGNWRQPNARRMAVILAKRLGLLLIVLRVFAGTPIEKAMVGFLVFLGCGYVVTCLAQVITYHKAFGRNLGLYMSRMRRLTVDSLAGSLSGLAGVMAVYGLLVILTAFLLHWRSFYVVGIFSVFHAAFIMVTRWLPPFVLLLSGSGSRAVSFAKRVNRIIIPMQATSLTQQADWGSVVSGMSRIRTLRRVPSQPWMEIVEEAMAMSRLIILDTRDVTSAVLDEVQAVRRHDYQFKTVAILSEEPSGTDQSEATPVVLERLRREVLSLSEENALSLLRHLRRDLAVFPERTRPVKRIVESSARADK